MQTREEDKFTLINSKLSASVADFINKPTAVYSDHQPITNQDSFVISWNTLQQCETWKGGEKGETTFYNNGFGKVESDEAYLPRRASLLSYLTSDFVNSVNSIPGQLPVRVICLQEMQSDDGNIEKYLHNGFKVAKLSNNAGSISQRYGSELCHLIMLHTSDLEPVEKCDLSSLNLVKPERYQAVKFRDRQTKDEFVVVNVHQDWGSVERGDKPALGNLKLIQRLFSSLPCVITGDFNTNNLPLENEAGRIVMGENTNIIWDVPTGKTRDALGACDHIIMNQKYCANLLPALRAVNGEAKSSVYGDSGRTLFSLNDNKSQCAESPSQPGVNEKRRSLL